MRVLTSSGHEVIGVLSDDGKLLTKPLGIQITPQENGMQKMFLFACLPPDMPGLKMSTVQSETDKIDEKLLQAYQKATSQIQTPTMADIDNVTNIKDLPSKKKKIIH
jgi:hypothetical protein